MITNTDAVPLPCPMCNASLSGASASGYHHHPANDCIFSGFEVSCDDVVAWNRRDPATQTDHSSDVSKMVAVEQTEAVRMDWVSVTERLPDDDAVVLVSAWQYGKPGGERFTMIARRSGSVFLDEESGDDLYTPTHWMPLPAAPASSAGERA